MIAEGIIIPGFQTENAVVSNSFSRKIYVTKVLGKTIHDNIFRFVAVVYLRGFS